MRHQFRSSSRAHLQGFTLLEAIIALFVLSFAFLGMAALMVQVTYMHSRSALLDQANQITRAKLGKLAHVDFSLLGTGSTAAEQQTWGAPGQAIIKIGPLNAKGEANTGTEIGPFRYTLSFVVCKDDANGGANAATANGDPCGDIVSSRPTALACTVSETIEDQAMVKVMTTYKDRHGKCHKSVMSQVMVNFS